MGNNNLNTQTLDNQSKDQQNPQTTTPNEPQAQPQGQTQDKANENPDGNQLNDSQAGEPTIAELMKQIAELKVDNRRIKKANDSLASENAGLKKQVNAKLTEEELRAQQKADEDDELRKEIAELRKENALNKATERYMSMKMPKELALKVAEAELEGDMDTVTSSINSFMEVQKKEVEEKVTAELYAKMPAPLSGNGDGQIDYERQYQEKLANGDITGAIDASLQRMFQANKS